MLKYGSSKYYPHKDRIPKAVHSIIDGKKICTKCNENKLISEYTKAHHTETGYMSSCKECNANQIREKRKNNKDSNY